MNDTRLVPMTRAQRDLLTQILIYLPNYHGDQVRQIIRARDAAPADPEKALTDAADLYFQEHETSGNERDATRALLLALGWEAPE